METPGATDQRPGPPATLPDPWEQGLRCSEERRPASARLSPRGASLCPPSEGSTEPQRPGPCSSGSRLIPAPRGAVLVQREKDLSAYNWNSFGLRYGRRRAAPEQEPGARGGAEAQVPRAARLTLDRTRVREG
ncbi:metastasis-suppressor KiSS-1 [Ochotona curzoniae]|uniref:metastasis-suppressor KiSS-1 n=1 Tax=Ochotona curzoniae TaxID=130825 RepID=UPI001B3514B6|nr:metastasis-suppressor KiSS-1 [Ochotona curzoniae]